MYAICFSGQHRNGLPRLTVYEHASYEDEQCREDRRANHGTANPERGTEPEHDPRTENPEA